MHGAVNVVAGAVDLLVPTQPGAKHDLSVLASLDPRQASQEHASVLFADNGGEGGAGGAGDGAGAVTWETQRVGGHNWASLFRVHGVTAIGHLVTDTEGLDCALLLAFPFWKLRPKLITFEHCHCDGPNSQRSARRPVYERTVAVLRAHGYAQLDPYENGPAGLFDPHGLDVHFALADES
mmetsp:Transcript_22159/g.50147  ORF Transcript_22159/g.50147 Transcript_22159/m.50147 type:complete len:180 (+) Transcript_22159:1018-1557(+)